MEDFRLDIIDQGPNARSIQLNLPKFTLVGATTRADADQPAAFPLRPGEPTGLLYAGGAVRHYRTVRGAAEMRPWTSRAPCRSRCAPAARPAWPPLLRWVRDYAQVRRRRDYGAVGRTTALTMIEIDDDGLDEMDKRLLEAMIYKLNGGPVGLSSLAVAVGEDASTLEDRTSLSLIMQGYISQLL